MNALSSHAKAARIMAEAIKNQAGAATDTIATTRNEQVALATSAASIVLFGLARAHEAAAEAMEAQIRAECSPPPAGPSVPITASPTASRRPPRR